MPAATGYRPTNRPSVLRRDLVVRPASCVAFQQSDFPPRLVEPELGGQVFAMISSGNRN